MRAQEAIGRALGGLVAPLTWLGSLARGARVFHPDGVVYQAEVRPLATEGAFGRLAARLAGTALVRLSGALRRWPSGAGKRDLLGIAVRFKARDEVTAEAAEGDQDLLFESAVSLWMLPAAAFRTNVEDFLGNQYSALLPFEVEGAGKVRFRLVPVAPSPAGGNLRERLERAVAANAAKLRLEVQRAARGEAWTPVAEISLRRQVDVNQSRLGFNPANDGKGIKLRGITQWTRPPAYAASRHGRRLAGRISLTGRMRRRRST